MRRLVGMTVCSGIGAPEVAAPFIDWRYQSEIEAFPSAVLKARFPHAMNLGDMTKFKEWPDHAIDLLCGGTPCQSFSVAGLRKGMADPRGNLALVYLAIADRYRPEWLLWENVPGVLSSNGGRDFGAFLGGLAELGYGFAYRVLDAQFVRVESHPWAVPQRRRRVFVVGHLGDWRRAAAVLFERESLSGHSPPRREAGKRTAETIEASPDGSGWPAEVAPTFGTGWGDRPTGSSNQDWVAQKGGHFVPEICGALSDGAHNGGGLTAKTLIRAGLLPPAAMCLNAGAMGRQDAESETLIPTTGGVFDVTHSLKADGFDASEDGTGRGTPIIAIQGAASRENPNSGHDGIGVREDGAAYTVEARAEVQAVAFSIMPQNSGKDYKAREVQVAQPVMAGGPTGGNQGGDYLLTSDFAQNQRDELRLMDVAGSLAAEPGMKQQTYLHQAMAVRRLTPLECERLQGFPDGHTAIEYRGKPAVDGPRYKAIGNSMAVNVMNWLLGRIHESHQNVKAEAA